MEYDIIRISNANYAKFSDLIYWRMTGEQRQPGSTEPNETIKKELSNCNLHIYALDVKNKFVGWISLVYIPKVGKFNGHGHIYVDELWIEPSYRNNGLAKALMRKADEIAEELCATGIRLYVSEDNSNAWNLYKRCGYTESGKAFFMEK